MRRAIILLLLLAGIAFAFRYDPQMSDARWHEPLNLGLSVVCALLALLLFMGGKER